MVKIYFDGACEPINPGGIASYGLVIFDGKKRIYEEGKLFYPKKGKERETSNNVAEYSGFLSALKYCIDHKLNKKKIVVYGDSNLVIQQMFGTWNMKKGFYIPIALEAQRLLKHFSSISGQWIPREKNGIADELSKKGLKEIGVNFQIQPE